MNKIQKVSSYLLCTFNFLIVFIPLFLALQWILISFKGADQSYILKILAIQGKIIETPEGYVNLSTVAWVPLLKLLGFCAEFIGVLPLLIGLFFLKKLFINYRNSEFFTQKNAALYRKLGLLYLINALLIKPLSLALMVVTVTITNPPGHRYLSLSFGMPNLTSLFYGALVIIISWVMLEASKLHDEHKFTI